MPCSPRRERLAWAAGLFDGEGCFYTSRVTPAASITQKDRRVLDDFRSVVVMGSVYYSHVGTPYHYQVTGLERVQALIAMLWSWLGEVKREQARKVLVQYRDAPIRRSIHSRTCQEGGCTEPFYAKEWCSHHYDSWRYKNALLPEEAAVTDTDRP